MTIETILDTLPGQDKMCLQMHIADNLSEIPPDEVINSKFTCVKTKFFLGFHRRVSNEDVHQ